MSCIQKKRRVEYRFWDKDVFATDKAEQVKEPENFGWSVKRGWFAGYGLELFETNETTLSYTVAIVENDDMGIDLVSTHCIKFIT